MFKNIKKLYSVLNQNTARFTFFILLSALLIGMYSCSSDSEDPPTNPTDSNEMKTEQLESGFQGSTGSTVGPDGALYVAENGTGKINRIDPASGDVTTYASGLPPVIPAVGIGGIMDIAFLDGTAYMLVTVVGSDVGGTDTVGLYRRDNADSFTIVANIGQFNIDNPPSTDFFVPTGVQYSMQPYEDGFLVTDGHLNRILKVGTDGIISILTSFENIVPTGLALSGNTIYMTETGPAPNTPESGKVMAINASTAEVSPVASGARMLVDVEFNSDHALYALSQGIWDGVQAGSPAVENTGSLVHVNSDGTVTKVVEDLDRPTSLEFIGNTAYITTLTGEVWTVTNVNGEPF